MNRFVFVPALCALSLLFFNANVAATTGQGNAKVIVKTIASSFVEGGPNTRASAGRKPRVSKAQMVVAKLRSSRQNENHEIVQTPPSPRARARGDEHGRAMLKNKQSVSSVPELPARQESEDIDLSDDEEALEAKASGKGKSEEQPKKKKQRRVLTTHLPDGAFQMGLWLYEGAPVSPLLAISPGSSSIKGNVIYLINEKGISISNKVSLARFAKIVVEDEVEEKKLEFQILEKIRPLGKNKELINVLRDSLRYVGKTNNIIRRAKQHTAGATGKRHIRLYDGLYRGARDKEAVARQRGAMVDGPAPFRQTVLVYDIPDKFVGLVENAFIYWFETSRATDGAANSTLSPTMYKKLVEFEEKYKPPVEPLAKKTLPFFQHEK
jgi:hypothetical protein